MFKRTLLSIVAAVAALPALASNYCFSVETKGSGKPVILIPGLTCPGSVWDGTVERLKSKYKCYVLTLPGFAGQAPISGPYLPHVRDDILAFVKDNHLDHPSVIGHSLGGFMVWDLACAAPDLFGPMISVDGLPFLSAMFNPAATAESMKSMADGMAKSMSTATREQFTQQTKSALDSEITDPKQADALLPLCSKSDPADVATAMGEMMTTDLRDDISKIKSPVLMIGVGGWVPGSGDMLKKTYQGEIAKCPSAQLVFDEKSRHFVMLDDPEFFYKTVEGFLARG
jgi:pimeloyl-ACP methyl ester carboxylesterase